jgi:hypothetical protein
MISGVYKTGEPFIGNEVRVQMKSVDDGKTLEPCYVNFIYLPLREADNSISGL